MYRYSVDNAVTYTPSDFRLFRESPFAVWMERLTLENPEHGSIPDQNSPPPEDEVQPQDEIVESLRDEERDVVLIDWELDEPRRRADTLDAMRSGADFIVNGMLALGPLAGSANLLMRTSGYSDFGDFLYIPCDTQGSDTHDAAFRLCFLADLLHSLQGQLPPQMLLIREDANVEPLQTEEHIYYYRAVKKRFMDAMGDFRKHRMPDPAESVHFGRWSDCARETLRRRDANPEYQLQAATGDEAGSEYGAGSDYEVAAPVARAAGNPNMEVAGVGHSGSATVESLHRAGGQSISAPTLAEQARMLASDAFRPRAAPGQTPNLARFPRLVTNRANTAPAEASGFADEALRDLAFIGSSEPAPLYDSDARTPLAAARLEQPPVPSDSAQDVVSEQESTHSGAAHAAGDAVAASEDCGVEQPERTAVAAADDSASPGVADAAGGATESAAEQTPGPLDERVSPQAVTAMPASIDAELQASADLLAAAAAQQTAADARQDDGAIQVGGGRTLDEAQRQTRPRFDAALDMPRDNLTAAAAAAAAAPAPTLRSTAAVSASDDDMEAEPHIDGYEVELIDLEAFDREVRDPHLNTREPGPAENGAESPLTDSDYAALFSMVDLDSAPPPTLGSVPPPAQPRERDVPPQGGGASGLADARFLHESGGHPRGDNTRSPMGLPGDSGDAFSDGISSSLITNEDYDGRP